LAEETEALHQQEEAREQELKARAESESEPDKPDTEE
jgi:hypothetical protein